MPEPRYSQEERLNLIANAVFAGWDFVPLTVRFKAARLADAFVTAWANEPAPAAERHLAPSLPLVEDDPPSSVRSVP